MSELEAIIRERRSVRGFRADPVPEDVIRDVFTLAQHAPSNCNVQPWRAFIASGARRDALREGFCRAAMDSTRDQGRMVVQTFPDEYRPLQVACAKRLYGEMGVERHDEVGRMRAFMRNFEFFDAPHVALICMDERFGVGVALDVGMYVQTLMLALWDRGIASCAQAALRAFPEVSREVLDIPEGLMPLCGLSFGYEDPDVDANRTRQTREPVEANVRFL